MESCEYCGGLLGAEDTLYHQSCDSEYWRRMRANLCLKCGATKTIPGALCVGCPDGSKPWHNYPG